MEEYTLTLAGQRIRLALQAGVFPPSVASLLLASRLSVPRGTTVCDLMTGSGIHAIIAAKQGAKSVVAIDIDANAVSCARRNAAINRVERRMRLETTSFSTFRAPSRFDMILLNAPQTPHGLQPPGAQASLQAGVHGSEINVSAISKAASLTERGATIMFTLDAIANPGAVIEHAEKNFRLRVVARHRCVARLFELEYCASVSRHRRRMPLWVGALDGLPAYEKAVVVGLRK